MSEADSELIKLSSEQAKAYPPYAINVATKLSPKRVAISDVAQSFWRSLESAQPSASYKTSLIELLRNNGTSADVIQLHNKHYPSCTPAPAAFTLAMRHLERVVGIEHIKQREKTILAEVLNYVFNETITNPDQICEHAASTVAKILINTPEKAIQEIARTSRAKFNEEQAKYIIQFCIKMGMPGYDCQSFWVDLNSKAAELKESKPFLTSIPNDANGLDVVTTASIKNALARTLTDLRKVSIAGGPTLNIIAEVAKNTLYSNWKELMDCDEDYIQEPMELVLPVINEVLADPKFYSSLIANLDSVCEHLGKAWSPARIATLKEYCRICVNNGIKVRKIATSRNCPGYQVATHFLRGCDIEVVDNFVVDFTRAKAMLEHEIEAQNNKSAPL